MSCSLFNDADDVTDALCGIVFQKYVNVVLVCFHSGNCPVVLACKIAYSTFYEVVDTILQQRLPLLCHKYDMYFKIVFASVSAIAAILHKFISSYYMFTKSML